MTRSLFDFLIPGGLFGNEEFKEISDLARQDALLVVFKEKVEERDEQFLSEAVIEHNKEIRSFDNPDLYMAHAMASVLVDNFSLGYASLKKYIGKNVDSALPGLTEALGLLAYRVGHFKEAKNLIDDYPLCDEALITKVCAEYEAGNKKVTVLEKRFGSHLNNVYVANSIIGKLYFEKERFDKADKYFKKAIELDSENITVHLNYLTNLNQHGNSVEDIYKKMPDFHAKTGIELTLKELKSELNKKTINIDLYEPETKMFSILVGLGL